MRTLKVRFEWTNWTFGVWWGKVGKTHNIGVDLGPLQMCWIKTEIYNPRRPQA